MKKVFLALLVVTGFAFQSCEGPMGPAGVPGRDGADGLLGEVIEVKGSFTTGNNFKNDFDLNPAIESTDKIVAFILTGKDGANNDNWEPLPQTMFRNGNTFLYTFDFSRAGFTLFLDSNVNPGLLPAVERTDRVFRILIIPAYLATNVDQSNMKEIMSKLGKTESDVLRDLN